MIGANGPHIFSPFRIVIIDRPFLLIAIATKSSNDTTIIQKFNYSTLFMRHYIYSANLNSLKETTRRTKRPATN